VPRLEAHQRRALALTEAQKTLAKKRQELARVLEWLGSPGLMPGIARELRKHVAILEREIAELEQA
jgi:exonuclease VII small subunit